MFQFGMDQDKLLRNQTIQLHDSRKVSSFIEYMVGICKSLMETQVLVQFRYRV